MPILNEGSLKIEKQGDGALSRISEIISHDVTTLFVRVSLVQASSLKKMPRRTKGLIDIGWAVMLRRIPPGQAQEQKWKMKQEPPVSVVYLPTLDRPHPIKRTAPRKRALSFSSLAVTGSSTEQLQKGPSSVL